MNKRICFIPLILCVMLLACNPTRRLKNDEALLVKNELKFTDRTYDKEQMLSIVKQKPNRKILWLFRFHLWLHNTVNMEKMEREKAEKIAKRKAWNDAHPDKKPKDVENVSTFSEWVHNIGEGPVIVDSTLTHRSSKQIGLFLQKKGYFNSIVTDTTELVGKKKAKVRYTISMGEPYTLRTITDSSLDQQVLRYINEHKSESLLRPGNNFDADVLDNERIRITRDLRNAGYYFFNKNYITYTVDSNLNSHKVDVILYINRVNEISSEKSTTGGEEHDHYQYYLNNVYLQDDYNPQRPLESVPTDTAYHNDYIFLTTSPYQRFRPDANLNAIFFKKGDRFDLSSVDYTYTRLSDLNVFRFTNIRFQPVADSETVGKHLLNAYVEATPVAMQDVIVEPEASRSGGIFGLAANVAYHNKNLFRGAEFLEIKLKAAAESQQSIAASAEPGRQPLFNTFEFGPEVNLSFKRFFFPASLLKSSRYNNPKTILTLSYNFQERPDYNRTIFTAAYWYTWKPNTSIRYSFYLGEISSIRAKYISEAFAKNLEDLKNPTLTNSFKTHVITSIPRASFEFSDQEKKHGMNFNYFRLNGDLGWKIFKNSFGFFRLDADYRHYFKLNAHNTFVTRAVVGGGIPFNDATSLPFEKAFSAGGSNDIRAWRFSTLGPGSYPNPDGVQQAGDFKVEGNLEVRSELFKFFEGALFADFGNIWIKAEDFKTTEIAMGAGAGIRLNFGFFIFRIDGAVRMYDPAREEPYKWVYSHESFSTRDINFNFGIGYPF